MVRSIHKLNIAVVFAVTGLAVPIAANMITPAKAANVDFNINVTEVLTVSLTAPTTWAQGDVDTLLLNKIGVSATTNNSVGALVSMYADATTLNNTSTYSSTDSATYINTLASNSTASAFPSDRWGYSILTDANASTASTTATYQAMTTSSSLIPVVTASGAGTTGSTNVFFGAKASSAKNSGTYAQTINFVAVTGTVDTSNPTNPTNPTVITDTTPASNTATYSSSTDQTSYTTRSTSGTATGDTTTEGVSGERKTTTTNINPGDTTSSYANAAGVTTTTTSSSSVAIALGVAAAVAAVSGTAFYLAGKNRSDDEE